MALPHRKVSNAVLRKQHVGHAGPTFWARRWSKYGARESLLPWLQLTQAWTGGRGTKMHSIRK